MTWFCENVFYITRALVWVSNYYIFINYFDSFWVNSLVFYCLRTRRTDRTVIEVLNMKLSYNFSLLTFLPSQFAT